MPRHALMNLSTMKQYNKAVFLTMILAAVTIGVMMNSCKKSKSTAATGVPTLYDTLGGTTPVVDPEDTSHMIEQGYLTIRTIVDTTMFTFASDPLLEPFFIVLHYDDSAGNSSEYISLSNGMTHFIAMAAGSADSVYTGMDLYSAHRHDSNSNMPDIPLPDSVFNEFVYDLSHSALDLGLSAQVVSQFGSMLYKYEGQIVHP
jgi:hypothetical protein